MTVFDLWRKIRETGRVAEPAPPRPAGLSCPKAGALHGSVQMRHVDAGSCNGCEIEIGSAFGPVYDAERYGARLVASPRHADALLVTGPVTRNMAVPLRRTFEAVSEPRMLSAAMVNLGVYGVIRVGFDLLGGGSRWWWLLVLTLGPASALYGILQAAVAADLKRLLAYSTVENMGLVFLGLGAAGIFHTSGAPALAALALAAALLHVLNHAGFKALLFTAAGSVLRATGTRDLDALGGLRSRMPATTILFAVGALGAAALPPGNGFVSEWLLLQSLVHALPAGGVVTAVALPLASRSSR